MEQTIIANLPPDDLAALDRVCRDQGVSRPHAVYNAVSCILEPAMPAFCCPLAGG